MRCDFCADESASVRWRYPAESFDFSAYPGHSSDGDWAACDECYRLIQAVDWPGLGGRLWNTLRARGFAEDFCSTAVQHAQAAWAQFRNYRVGDPVPV